jgi:tripartite-type tricarboxylate transporter receptor subunit TctC
VTRPSTTRRDSLRALAALGAAGLVVGAGRAEVQDFPRRPLSLIVPFPAGGTADALGRVLAKGLGEGLGRQVVVDNRPGAGGRVGTTLAARANPDGHTILLGSISAFSIEPVLRTSVGYDPVGDFTAVLPVAEMPFVLVVPADSPVHSVDELVAAAKAQPGKLTYATWGLGTSCHLVTEQFATARGVSLAHVPYKGAVNAMTDLAAGRIGMMFALPFDATPHIASGRLRPLAVTGTRRLPGLPEVPTLAQLGVSGIDMNAWFGVFVPARTPAAVVKRLRSVLEPVMTSGAMQSWIQTQGAVAFPGGPEDLVKRIRADAVAAVAVAKTLSLRLED